MLYLKACLRCRGDVRFALDTEGPFLQCLQCGFRVTSAHRDLIAAAMTRQHRQPAPGNARAATPSAIAAGHRPSRESAPRAS